MYKILLYLCMLYNLTKVNLCLKKKLDLYQNSRLHAWKDMHWHITT